MFIKQLLGLTLSTFLTVAPAGFNNGRGNYIPNEREFPMTRTDNVYWRTSYDIDDLGQTTSTLSDAIGKHRYVINYTVTIFCSSACTLAQPSNSTVAPITDSIIEFRFQAHKENLPSDMANALWGIHLGGSSTATNTYSNQYAYGIVPITIEHLDGTWDLNINFPALSEGAAIDNVGYWTEELYFLTLANALRDTKDIPSSVMQQYTQYINDGDYSQAIQYISNYYETTNVTNNEETLQVINQYQDKETDLQTVTETEHNFSIDIEDDFNDQIQAIDTENSVISNSNFQQSALWVTDKFNRFTVNNAFGSILGFSLLLGLAMAIIGRVIK